MVFSKKKNKNSFGRQGYSKNYFFIDGSFYIINYEFLKKHKKFVVENQTFFKLNSRWPIDIDEKDDLALCDLITKNKNKLKDYSKYQIMKKDTDYIKAVYNETDKPFTSYPKKLIKHLFNKLKMNQNESILEIGCGRGEFLNEFIEKGLDGYGLDVSKYSAEKFQKLNLN